MMSIRVRRVMIALASAAGLAFAGTTMAQTEVLKIGVVTALSGPGSEWGLAQDGGIKIAAMEANARGGLEVGGKTYRIEVISYDDQYKAAMSVSGATRLIEQDKVRFVFGPLGSAAVLAVKPLWERNGILAILGGYSEKVLDKDTRYSYRGYPTQTEFAGPIVQWLRTNHPNLKTVAQIEPNDETGWSSSRLLTRQYESAGFRIVSSELVERTVRDFQPVLTRVLAAKPDLIELATTPNGTAGLMIRQAREMGYKGQFIKTGGPGVPQLVAAAGKESAEGLIYYAAADPSTAAYKELEQKYAQVLKPPMNEFTVYFYDMAGMLLQAMQRAGTVEDADRVRAELEKLSPYDGMQGAIRWGGMEDYGSNHQILTPVFVGTIRDGGQEIVGRID